VGDHYTDSPPDGDDEDEENSVAVDVGQGDKKEMRTKRTYIPAGLDTYPWATEMVQTAKADMGRQSIWAMVTIGVILLVFWFILLWIPSLPPAIMRYGAIYFFFLFPLYLFNLLLSYYTSVNEFYRVGLALNIFGVILEVFIAAILGYNYYACQTEIYPSTCRGNYLVDGVVSIAMLVLLFKGLECLSNCIYIVMRTSGVTSPRYYAYKQQAS